MEQIPQFDGYLFDMGNTLLDFHQGSSDQEKDLLGVERLAIHLAERHNLPITTDCLEKEFLRPWLGDFYLRSRGRELDVASYLNNALESFQIKLESVACQDAMKVWFSEYKNQVVVNPNALVTLRSLREKGKKVAVVSNSTIYEEVFRDVFDWVGLTPFIQAFVFSYSHGARKPNAVLYEEALRQLGLNADQTVMVGDRLDTDLLGARQLGIHTIWYNPNQKPRIGTFYPEHVISDFSQLLGGTKMVQSFGACGCVCSDCRIFGKECGGCHSIEGKPCWLPEVSLAVCDFYECAVLERGFRHCGHCSSIPCNKFWTNKNPAWTDEQHKQIVEERVVFLKARI